MSVFTGLGSVGTMVASAATVGMVAVGGIMVMEAMKAEDPQDDAPVASIAPVLQQSGPETETAVAPQPEKGPETGPDNGPDNSPVPPSFDVVRVDADGNALVAGRAAGNATVIVFIDGQEAHRTTADPAGSFAAIFTVPLSTQPRIVSLSMEVGQDPAVASTSSVILAPSVLPPEPLIAQAPEAPVLAALEEPPQVDITETPLEKAEVTPLTDPVTEIAAEEGTPAPKPDIIAAITPEPSTDLPKTQTNKPDTAADPTPDPIVANAALRDVTPDERPTEVAGTADEGAPDPERVAALDPDDGVVFEVIEGQGGPRLLPLETAQTPEPSTAEALASLSPEPTTEPTPEPTTEPSAPAPETVPETVAELEPETVPETVPEPIEVAKSTSAADRETLVSSSARDAAPPANESDVPFLGKSTAAVEPTQTDPPGQAAPSIEADATITAETLLETAAPVVADTAVEADTPVETLASVEAEGPTQADTSVLTDPTIVAETTASVDPLVLEAAAGPSPERAEDPLPDGPTLVQTAEAPAPEAPAPNAPPVTAPPVTASLEATTEAPPLQPVQPVAALTTRLPETDARPQQPVEPVAPSVLLADETGIRVLQSGGAAPQVKTVIIDTITYDPAGEVSLGGRGAGTGFVRVYLNNKPIQTTEIAPDGQWRTPLPEVDTGVYTLRIDEVNESGNVTSRVETPFKREEPEVLAALDTRADDAKAAAIAVLTVQPGNTLWGIASEEYGDGFLYVRVFEANKDRIRNPNLIYPGQVFAIPE